jgi:hypothetical protein
MRITSRRLCDACDQIDHDGSNPGPLRYGCCRHATVAETSNSPTHEGEHDGNKPASKLEKLRRFRRGGVKISRPRCSVRRFPERPSR